MGFLSLIGTLVPYFREEFKMYNLTQGNFMYFNMSAPSPYLTGHTLFEQPITVFGSIHKPNDVTTNVDIELWLVLCTLFETKLNKLLLLVYFYSYISHALLFNLSLKSQV